MLSAKERSIITICYSAADKLCSSDVINTLLPAGMTPIPSPQLKARRSVIAKKVSTEIFDSTEAFVKKELQGTNDWAANHIESTNKFQNLPFLKITFNSIDMMKNCLKN